MLALLVLFLATDRKAKPDVLHIRNWEVPRIVTITCLITLNLATEKVGWAETNLGMGAFRADKGWEVVIDNVITVPATEDHGF